MRLILITILSTLVIGCVAGGDIFKPKESWSKNKALVYLYRSSDYQCAKVSAASADPNFLFVNDNRIFAFRCNTYTSLELDPGTYRFSIKANFFYLPTYERNGAKTFDFLAGNTYYIKYKEDYAFTDTAAGRAIEITNSTFEKTEGAIPPADLSQTRYVDSSAQSFK